MEVKEMREKKISDLYDELRKTRLELEKLKLDISINKSSDFNKKRNLRKKIAKIKTIISEKEVLKNEKA